MNKQDVDRTQPKGCSTSELDAAIDQNYISLRMFQMKNIYSQEIGRYDSFIEHHQLVDASLKFMRLMMEPSDELLEELQDEDFSQDTAMRILPEAVQACLKEVQGE